MTAPKSDLRRQAEIKAARPPAGRVSLTSAETRRTLTAANLLGMTRSTLIRQPVTRFILEADREIFYLYRKKLFESGAAQSAELRLRRPDDTIFWANLEATVTKDATGAPECRLLISDISERKQADAYREMGREVLEILNRPGDLLEAITRIIAAIQTLIGCEAVGIGEALTRHRLEKKLLLASEELRRSNLDLEQFAYVAGHDLQEPLRIISCFLTIVESRYTPQLDDKAREYIGYSVEAAQRMSQLITDLLAYARVGHERGLVPVDLGMAVETALANLQVGLGETDAKLIRDPLPTLPVNLRELAQVFQNLLGNALKFRRPGLAPEIHIGAKKLSVAAGPGFRAMSQDSWLITVSDNGLGLEPRHAERIFTIFQRLHARGQYPGTGVGLAICKKIIERHGGRIWVESEPGHGARFCFTLPA